VRDRTGRLKGSLRRCRALDPSGAIPLNGNYWSDGKFGSIPSGLISPGFLELGGHFRQTAD
jgi:hypothetical protein